jgi:hypothetical protein
MNMLIKRIEPIYNMKKENHNQNRKRKSKMKNKNINQNENSDYELKLENVYCNYNSKGGLI